MGTRDLAGDEAAGSRLERVAMICDQVAGPLHQIQRRLELLVGIRQWFQAGLQSLQFASPSPVRCQFPLDFRALDLVECVEKVTKQQFAHGLVHVGFSSGRDRFQNSFNFWMAAWRRLLTVPTGTLRISAASRYFSPW